MGISGEIIDRTGEKRLNNFGSTVEIVTYRNVNDIDVYFEEYDYTSKHLSYSNFKKGRVACPYEKRTYGKGYMGEGKYKSKENKKLIDSYDMLGWFIKEVL